MLNQTVLVGRLYEQPEIKMIGESKKIVFLLAVTRSFKNLDGTYDTDIIPVIAFNCIAENMYEYCKKGDLIGVKGHLEIIDEKLIVLAKKITTLSKENESEEK